MSNDVYYIYFFFYTDFLCVYTERPKMKRLQRMKKGCWCLCVSSSLNIFDNNAALLKCQYSYITLLIFPSTIIWRWRLVDHLHFVPGLSTIHSGDMRYNLFWILGNFFSWKSHKTFKNLGTFFWPTGGWYTFVKKIASLKKYRIPIFVVIFFTSH